MGRIDLHTHSTYSDGTMHPIELVELAKQRGVDVLALTDHDTIAGIPEARKAAALADVELVHGVEFSAEHDGNSIHVLAYWPNEEDPEFLAELMRLQETRL